MPLVVTNDAGEKIETQFLNPHSNSTTGKMIEDAKNLAMSAVGNLQYVSSIDNLTPEQVQSLLTALAEIREKTLEIRGKRFLQHGGIEGVDLERYLEEQARIC